MTLAELEDKEVRTSPLHVKITLTSQSAVWAQFFDDGKLGALALRVLGLKIALK